MSQKQQKKYNNKYLVDLYDSNDHKLNNDQVKEIFKKYK